MRTKIQTVGMVRVVTLAGAGLLTLAGCPELTNATRDSGTAPLTEGEELEVVSADELCDMVDEEASCLGDMPEDGADGGMLWGHYSRSDEGTGVFDGGFVTYTGLTQGDLMGEWADDPEAPGGFAWGRFDSDRPGWSGELMGEYNRDQDRRFEGLWMQEDGRNGTIKGRYKPFTEVDGGVFVGRFDLEREDPTHHVLNIRNKIDGRSRMTIDANSAMYHHDDYAAPGRLADFPEGSTDEPTRIQGIDWQPGWPEAGENRDCNCDSSTYEQPIERGILVPSRPATVELELIEARHEVRLLQTPSEDNGYQLIIEWDDNPPGGDAFYEVNIHFYMD